jgi:hypothetical protein
MPENSPGLLHLFCISRSGAATWRWMLTSWLCRSARSVITGHPHPGSAGTNTGTGPIKGTRLLCFLSKIQEHSFNLKHTFRQLSLVFVSTWLVSPG